MQTDPLINTIRIHATLGSLSQRTLTFPVSLIFIKVIDQKLSKRYQTISRDIISSKVIIVDKTERVDETEIKIKTKMVKKCI